jgi:hypothetical protein
MPAFPIAPTSAIAPAPSAANNAPTANTGTNAPPAANTWVSSLPALGEGDPFVCPGLNNDCFHYVRRVTGYYDHIARKHGYTRKSLDRPENAAAKGIFMPPRQLSWYQAQRIDTTYQGDEPKQKAARKRMDEGITTSHPDYAKRVYGSVMKTLDV